MDPQTDDDLRPLPTVQQLADKLGVHRITIYKAIAEGDIAAIRADLERHEVQALQLAAQAGMEIDYRPDTAPEALLGLR